MANYEQLKASIIAAIYNNGNQEITGEVLQSVLLSIVNIIGANATFSGVATPTTAPGTSDQLVFYIAGQPGTYANFGGAKLNNGELAVFSNPNGAWKTEKIALFRSYDAAKILALTTSSSSDDIKAAFTPIGGSEVYFPKVGDYIISQSQQLNKAKPNSVVTESTETVLTGKRIAFLANGINYAITIVFVVGGTYKISSISKAEIGADTDTANASGSVYGRIAKNAEDIRNLQDEQRAVYNANLITALNVGSSVEQALTVNGEYRLPISGDVLLSDTESGVFVSSNSVQTKVTFVYQIGTDIVTVVFNRQTKQVTSISTSSVGSPDDAADKDGSAFARIAQNTEDVKSLQHEPSLHDLWLQAGATYQKETDTYTLNDVSGLTYPNMLDAWRAGAFIPSSSPIYQYALTGNESSIKTNFPCRLMYLYFYDTVSLRNRFYACSSIVAIRFISYVEGQELKKKIDATSLYQAFKQCTSLVRIDNVIKVNNITSNSEVTSAFADCNKLEKVRLEGLKVSLSFAQSPNLTVTDDTESTLGYLVTNAANTSPITITLHPDAYIKLEESLIQKAQEKQISIVSA